MEQTCKQCGRKFELTEKEIEFYQKNGLNLPNRCKECRQVKKVDKPGQDKPGHVVPNSSEAALLKGQATGRSVERESADEADLGPAPGWTKGKIIASLVLMVVVLIVCFGGTYLVHRFW